MTEDQLERILLEMRYIRDSVKDLVEIQTKHLLNQQRILSRTLEPLDKLTADADEMVRSVKDTAGELHKRITGSLAERQELEARKQEIEEELKARRLPEQ